MGSVTENASVDQLAFRPDDPVEFDDAVGAGASRRMTIPKAIFTVVACALLFALVGGAIGCALGALAPGYYRAVFRHGQEPWFDPLGVGLGLGVTQGISGGALIGVALVVILVWRRR